MNISLLSLQTQPKTAPNLFQRGVEYGKYDLYIYTKHLEYTTCFKLGTVNIDWWICINICRVKADADVNIAAIAKATAAMYYIIFHNIIVYCFLCYTILCSIMSYYVILYYIM